MTLGLFHVDVEFLSNVADSVLERGDNAYPEPFFRGQNKVRPPADDNRLAVLSDGSDDFHQMLQVFIGPDMPLVDK